MLILISMSFLSQKVKISMKNQFQWWSIITYLMFGLMIGSLLLSSIIIYNYTFRTLEDAHTIVLLNTDTVVNNVNLDMYKRAVDAIKLKSTRSEIDRNLRNIFVFNTSSPAVVPASPITTTSPVSGYVSTTSQQ